MTAFGQKRSFQYLDLFNQPVRIPFLGDVYTLNVNYHRLMMSKIAEPHELSKRNEGCDFRLSDGSCCHSMNFLRPRKCNSYCVISVSQWLRDTHPELDNEAIKNHVARITQH